MSIVLRGAVHLGLRRDHHQAAVAAHHARQLHPAHPVAAAVAMIVPDQRRSKLT